MANTIIYGEEWATKLQERLDHTTIWKEVCHVEYTDTRVLNNPYIGTYPTVQTGTRGSQYTHQDVTETNETITINTYKVLPLFIDRADLAQSTFSKQMELADFQGQLLNETIETAMLASHAVWTNLGDLGGGQIGLGSTAITVSSSNIDDIIRGLKREIRSANGTNLMNQKGVFIIWRPSDFEILEAFIQANGFVTADTYLKAGTVSGLRYMGVDHYTSNDFTAGHVFAGVKDTFHLGICKSTYGQVVIDQEPAINSGTGGAASGIGVIARVDYAFKAWTKTVPVLFDINVA